MGAARVIGAHMLAAALVTAAAATLSLAAEQSPPPPPSFEVASVRRNTSGDSRTMMDGAGGRYTVTNATLRALVRIAYDLQEEQLVAPRWIESARFDIRASRGGAPFDQAPAMLRTLLAERFGLKAHVETRQMPMYALVTSRADSQTGPNLTAATDCETGSDLQPGLTRPGGRMMCRTQLLGPGSLRAGGIRLRDLAPLLSRIAGRLVIDRTELAGRYDIDLSWPPDIRGGPSGDLVPGAGPGVSVFTALQEQLGLKLTGDRGPVDVLVVDRIDEPSEN